MKNVTMLSLIFLTACNDPSSVSTSNSSTVSTASSVSTSTESENTVTTPTYTKYLYGLNSDFITAYPIDPSTGDLIQPQYGTWTTSSIASQQLNGFNSMFIDPTGSFIYAFSPHSTSLGSSAIYQYKITQNTTYTEYVSNIPLTALSPASVTSSIYANQMTYGSDGNVYLNSTATGGSVDQYGLNSSTGLLSLVKNVMNASLTVTLDWTVVTSVTNGEDTYSIDTQTNRILHYRNGVLEQSFSPLNGLPKVLALH